MVVPRKRPRVVNELAVGLARTALLWVTRGAVLLRDKAYAWQSKPRAGDGPRHPASGVGGALRAGGEIGKPLAHYST